MQSTVTAAALTMAAATGALAAPVLELATQKLVVSLAGSKPITDATMSDGSCETFADGPWLTKPAMSWFWDAYLPEVAARKGVRVSPFNATLEQLEGLPPALVITAENDERIKREAQ